MGKVRKLYPGFQRNPLYQQVADFLREEISNSLQLGDKLEAESKLCKRLKVSLVTIREALSILAQEGVVERRHGSGTYVANPKDHRHLAVLIDLDIATPNLSPFYVTVVQACRRLLEEQQLPVRLYVGHKKPGITYGKKLSCKEFISDMKKNLLSGVIAIGVDPFKDWYLPLVQNNIPVVGSSPAFEQGIQIHSEAWINKGIDYLIGKHRQRIAFIGWGNSHLATYKARLTSNNLVVNDKWIQCPEHLGHKGAGFEAFNKIWQHDEKPDALFISDDMCFPDVAMAVLSHSIKVPEQLLICTHANHGHHPYFPFPVTVVETNPVEYAELAVDLLLKLIDKPAAVLPPPLCSCNLAEIGY